MIRFFSLLIITALLLAVPVRADELEDVLGVPALEAAVPQDARDVLGSPELRSFSAESALTRLGRYAGEKLTGVLGEVLRPLAEIIVCCLLGAVGACMEAGGQTGLDAPALGSCLAIAVIGIGDVQSVMALGQETLETLLDFSRVLLPTLTSAAAAAGAVSSAGNAYAASAVFSDLLLTAAEGLILPMICGFVAVTAASAVLNDRRLDGAQRFLRWSAKSLMKLLVLAFTACLSLTGILSAAADASAVKAARTVLSAALPVVGRLLADASEALVAGAGLIRGAVGVYGLLVCLAALLLPVLRLGLRCLLFRGAAAICSGFSGARQTGLLSGLADAYGMLLGLVGSGAAVEFLAIISLIRTVTV